MYNNRKRGYSNSTAVATGGKRFKRKSQPWRVRQFGLIQKPATRVNFGIGFPKEACVTHKYSQTFSLTSTTGSLATQVFSANGMFDPDITGVGHQPFYYDQMSALYNHYTVIASKITLRSLANGTTDSSTQIALLMDDDGSLNGYSAIGSVIEQTQVKPSNYCIINGASPPVKMSQYFNAKKIFGVDPVGLSQFTPLTSANPSEQTYFIVCAQGPGGATTTLQFQIEIEYTAVWTELTQANTS